MGTNHKNIRERWATSPPTSRSWRKARTGAEQERLDRNEGQESTWKAEDHTPGQQGRGCIWHSRVQRRSLKAIERSRRVMEMLEEPRWARLKTYPLKEMGLESLEGCRENRDGGWDESTESNELFIQGRGEQVSDWGQRRQPRGRREQALKWLSPKSMEIKNARDVREFLWKNMKPLTAFEAIGSPKLMELFPIGVGR